ncbi:type I restriction endonuclease [Micromonospora profundi]|uniref:Type I restriction endonuclease n=1 Tax=Micromonospora profundi TaxID=1420889 RepID=A0AAJ6L4N3_9ACTN|nr:type I restriction endonuclease [Micromonospora profundi]WLS44773.1 type I restriction endonuclease [Micromonospora profundi]
MADHNEAVFESEICAYLESHGWLYSANGTGYDRERALFPEDLFAWLRDTQQAAYEKALKAAGSQAKFLDVLTTALDKPLEHGGGTLNILRNGVQYIGGGRLKMAQFRPETSLNRTTNEQYAAMRVRVMRQVHFSTADRRSIDLVFFVNGLPVATVELKTDFTQSLDEAINQYRKSRHPLTNGRPEPLLSFGHRALVHFAVSNDLAAMTTKLEGEKTHFLPFNMGHDSGAGNPPGEGGRSATAYLWERVWEKDAWLTIIGRLMIVEIKEEWDVETGTSVRRTSMLFPRFHQWEAVTNIVAAVREGGGASLLDRAFGRVGEDEHHRLNRAPAGAAALLQWAAAGHHSLREITRDDVVRALPPSGNPRSQVEQGLKSIFRLLKARRMVFTDPTARIAPGRHETRQPLPVDLTALRQALASNNPAHAAVAALIAFHGVRTSQVQMLRLTDVRDRVLHVDDRAIPLAEPVQQALAVWLDYRRSRWPRTTNTYLFVTTRTASTDAPVSRQWVWQATGPRLSATDIRQDRILDEAQATNGDVRRLADLFGLSIAASNRYAATVEHPDLTALT